MDEVAETLVHVRSGGTNGSGVVLRDDGHVLTTAELVGDAEEVRVQAVDGPELVGDVVGVDPATDVAVLLVQGLDQLGAVLGRGPGPRGGGAGPDHRPPRPTGR